MTTARQQKCTITILNQSKTFFILLLIFVQIQWNYLYLIWKIIEFLGCGWGGLRRRTLNLFGIWEELGGDKFSVHFEADKLN